MQNYRYFQTAMPSAAQNPNLFRRPLQGLLARLAAPLLSPLLRSLRLPGNESAGVTVFASYMVGDFFMALPALKALKKSEERAGRALRILCRPDCLALLEREGLSGIPFADPFRARPSPASFVGTWKTAWSLRGRLGPTALDLDADPRTAFWLKVAGVRTVVSYRRAYGVLFDETFVLPPSAIHQTERDMRVVETWST